MTADKKRSKRGPKSGSEESTQLEDAEASVEPQAEVEAEAEGAQQGDVEGLTAELKDLEDRHLRLAAEFDNFRKRTERERAQTAERGQADLVKQLLEPLDDLARVSNLEPEGQDPKALVEGVALVEQKLNRALEQSGLEPIKAVDQPFDPELHDALATTPTDRPEEDGLVSQELGRGYLFRGMLLRPSLVQVKKLQPRSEVEDEEAAADEEDS